jgi:predicted N-acetyltransferase YhbS
MPPTLQITPITPHTRQDAPQRQQVVDLWNAACGDDLAISPRLVADLLQPSPGLQQIAALATVDATPVGLVATSILPTDPAVAPPTEGWIDALAVTPSAQRQGIGSTLLAWAEAWLVAQGAETCVTGTGLRLFVAGIPESLTGVAFFRYHGYDGNADAIGTSRIWDVAADLARYTPPADLREVDALIRPAQPNDRAALTAFLQREFPGRWRYEFEDHLRRGGRIADYMLLWTADGVDGCCVTSFEDSLRPIERFFPYRLPRPWGQLGSIGVSAHRRGQGLGSALLDAGLRRLHNNGVNGCIIDWTTLLDFYGRFGFAPHRSYLTLRKTL